MKAIKIPMLIMWFVIRRPIISFVFALWIIATAFLGVLQLSPEAQRHFNGAIEAYGFATASMMLSSAAESALDVSQSTNRKLSSELKTSNAKIASLEVDVKHKTTRLKSVDIFQQKANSIVKRHNIRLTKTVIKTAAGEVVAWVPVVGDAASIYFAVDGTIEMCNMFKELEATSYQHGLPFNIYTDTFCEKPVEKSIEAIVETYTGITESVGSSLQQQSENRSLYWSEKLTEMKAKYKVWSDG